MRNECNILILNLFRDHPFNSTCLSVCEVVLAESLPQQPVLSEGPQLGTHLAQADQVPAVRQTLHNVELQAGRQVSQSHACWCGLQETGGRTSLEYNRNLPVKDFLKSQNFTSLEQFVSSSWSCILGTALPCWSGCCPAAAATARCSPCGAPRCWCSPPGQTCPCPEQDHTARCTASAAALWSDEHSAGRQGLSGEIRSYSLSSIYYFSYDLKGEILNPDCFRDISGKQPNSKIFIVNHQKSKMLN